MCNTADNFFTNQNTNQNIDRIAKEQFLVELRPFQRVAINNTLEKRDQIVLLPTSYGKSLCFFLPALLLDGITVIVYPLLALTSDQERAAKNKNIPCVVLKGGQTKAQRKEIFKKLDLGCHLVIATVETLHSKVLSTLSKYKIAHFVVDEAHCISEWGDTFRPSYLGLGKIIKVLNPASISCFTATASQRILKRINDVVYGARNKVFIVRGNIDRPNITYHVCKTAAKLQAILLLIKILERPILIFCGTRALSEELAIIIQNVIGNNEYNDDVARYYHAGNMPMSKRKENEAWYFNKSNAILCATCAYGMGVDKSNIRSVIHYSPTENVEEYLQESGRIGRDGKPSIAIMLYDKSDLNSPNIKNEMKEYCVTKNCRRQFLLDVLENGAVECSGCDNCGPKNEQNALLFTHTNKIISAIKSIETLSKNLVFCNKNIFTRDSIITALMPILNKHTKVYLGVNIWDASSVNKVTNELFLDKSIQLKKGIFKSHWVQSKQIITKARGKGILFFVSAIFLAVLKPLRRLLFSLRFLGRREVALVHSFSLAPLAFLHNLLHRSKKVYTKK